MTLDIALVLIIVAVAVYLFVSDRLRVDLIALLVLGSLVVAGLVTPTEALSGFSSPAVVTVWAVFILSGGLTRTGVANVIGQQVLRLAGNGEARLMFMIMLTAAVLSAFMNNVGVAALLLPVVMEIARRTNRPPSRLLLPLAFGALLGGMTTLIGTPPNILANEAVSKAGLGSFQLFDFAPVGLAVLLAGLAFMVFIGRRLLPSRNLAAEVAGQNAVDLEQHFRLEEYLILLRIPDDSMLAGMSLVESQVGSMLGLNVVAIMRNGHLELSPEPRAVLNGGDRLLVVGNPYQLDELRRHRVDTLERANLSAARMQAAGLELAEARLPPGSPLKDQTLDQASFRNIYGLNVLAVCRSGTLIGQELSDLRLREGDALYLQGSEERMASFRELGEFDVGHLRAEEVSKLGQRLLLVRIPAHSLLAGKTLLDSRLGAAFGLTVLRIVRDDASILLPEPEQRIEVGDTLLVQGVHEDIKAIRGLEGLELERSPPDLEELESADIGLAEVVLSPHTRLVGKTLRELRFRDKYALNVLAIWRAGEAYQLNLRDMPLRFGDALLLYGARDKIQLLATSQDFLVLDVAAQEPPRSNKAPLAVGIMVAVMLTVVAGWLPIAIAAVIGGALMVLTGCLTMEEAHRFIEWPAVFLIAGMLPLGIAMQNTGAASFLADGMMGAVGGLGPIAIIVGLFLLSTLASQVMPNPAVVVLMAPIALTMADQLDVSPLAFVMVIAVAASASFMSPVSHPANVLVMGPGGYRFADYIRVGLPLTLVVLVVVLIVLPIVWPL